MSDANGVGTVPRDPTSRFESLWVFVALLAAVIAVGCTLWLWIIVSYDKLPDRAAFGELFGGINTLFAGLAFAALTYTLILQQRALSLQRAQLFDQQKELTQQNDRQSRQAFESMLVQLLGFHHELVKDVRVSTRQLTFQGRKAFRELADELQGQVVTKERESGNEPSIQVTQDAYEAFHNRSRGVLDHYFRNLYHIVKFIDASDLPDPRRYTSLVRAQLSPAELVLLFYNGLSRYGDKFRPLMVKYALLEQLPDSELVSPGHKSLYPVAAYG